MRQENKMTIEQYMDELKIEKKDHNIIFNNEWFLLGKDKYFSYWVYTGDETKGDK